MSSNPNPVSHTGVGPGLRLVNHLNQALKHIRVGGTTTRRTRAQLLAPHGRCDIVQFVHSLDGRAFVEEIHQNKCRLLAVLFLARIRGITQVAFASGRGVGGRHITRIRILDVQNRGLVQEVVHEHEFARLARGGKVILDARGAIRLAGKVRGRGYFVWVLPNVRPLIQKVRCLRGRIHRCHKRHQP